ELRVLRQESVARMHTFGPRLARDLDQPFDDEIALASRRRPDWMRFGAKPNVARVRIGFRIDRDCPHTHALCRLRNTAGNLSTICDEDGFEHEVTRPGL